MDEQFKSAMLECCINAARYLSEEFRDEFVAVGFFYSKSQTTKHLVEPKQVAAIDDLMKPILGAARRGLNVVGPFLHNHEDIWSVWSSETITDQERKNIVLSNHPFRARAEKLVRDFQRDDY